MRLPPECAETLVLFLLAWWQWWDVNNRDVSTDDSLLFKFAALCVECQGLQIAFPCVDHTFVHAINHYKKKYTLWKLHVRDRSFIIGGSG